MTIGKKFTDLYLYVYLKQKQFSYLQNTVSFRKSRLMKQVRSSNDMMTVQVVSVRKDSLKSKEKTNVSKYINSATITTDLGNSKLD